MPPATEKHEEIKLIIRDLFANSPDWISFYRETLGRYGVVRRAYPSLSARKEFEQTEAYRELQQMLTVLRRRRPARDEKKNPLTADAPQEATVDVPQETVSPGERTRVITVRIPESLHDSLLIEAYEHQTSMNKLCISKLLQFIDAEMVPKSISEGPGESTPESA